METLEVQTGGKLEPEEHLLHQLFISQLQSQ